MSPIHTNPSHNPMQAEMADESMVRCLQAQAQAIWPHEQALFSGLGLKPSDRILDVGCGTGEISSRLATLSGARVIGLDLIEEHLNLARQHPATADGRLEYVHGDALMLPFEDDQFDLVVCRHMLHAIPDVDRALVEMRRVARPGGRLYLLAEDYGMIFAHPTRLDMDTFWRDGAWRFAESRGADLRSGRKIPALLMAAGVQNLVVRHVQIDSLNTDRAVLRDIFISWRDGHAAPVAEATDLTEREATDYFNALIDAVDDPNAYVCWMIPQILAQLTDTACGKSPA